MIAQSVAEIISRHVRLTVEGIDRMYLNVFVPGLQYEQGIVQFFRTHRGQPLPSAALMSPMTRGFVAKLEDFVARHDIPLVQFEKGQRKDAVMADHLRRFAHEEGVMFVGKAQENTPVFRTERRRSENEDLCQQSCRGPSFETRPVGRSSGRGHHMWRAAKPSW